MGLWLSWESASFASRRSAVRIRSAPCLFRVSTSDRMHRSLYQSPFYSHGRGFVASAASSSPNAESTASSVLRHRTAIEPAGCGKVDLRKTLPIFAVVFTCDGISIPTAVVRSPGVCPVSRPVQTGTGPDGTCLKIPFGPELGFRANGTEFNSAFAPATPLRRRRRIPRPPIKCPRFDSHPS